MSTLRSHRAWLPPLLAFAVAACSSDRPSSEGIDASAQKTLAATPAALLPGVALGPQPGAAGSGLVDGTYLSDVESCGQCHPDAFAMQQASAHAFASFNNPIYRASVEVLRDDRGALPSEMCAGCHDASLLVDGAMASAIGAADPRAHNGVSCRLCHGVEKAARQGNGSFTLRALPIPLPVDGDAASLARHVRAVRPTQGARLCGSCHESFLSEASGNRDKLAGQNEFSSWTDSAYSGHGAGLVDRVEPRDCVQCHMPRVPATLGDAAADASGRISSHQFLGGHTYLAAMRGDGEMVDLNASLLDGVVSLDVVPAQDGDSWLLDVVMRNTGVGHRFPGGVRDAANTWLEIEVLDARGRVIATGKPGEEHRLRTLVADSDGRLLSNRETHHFAAPIADHTIAPRQVALVRYRYAATDSARSLRVRLLHQSRSPELAALACNETLSERGQSFSAAAIELGRDSLDGCAVMPTSEVARIERPLATSELDFKRAYEHGLGLMGEVQERVSQARPGLLHALGAARGSHQRAMALGALGQLEARLGRVTESLEFLREAAALAPRSAAIPAARGDALARVWRWAEAAGAYREATELAGGNVSVWRRYALALGSSGEHKESLIAAQVGLRLDPDDADLLRVQALALAALGASDAEAAMRAYLEHRAPDGASAVLLKCTQRSAMCARESLTVHEHVLVPVSRR